MRVVGPICAGRSQAEQIGKVTTEILAPAPADVDRLFDEAVAIEERSWKGEAGTALAHDPHRAAFYRQYAHAASRAGVLRMCFLRVADRAIAMQIAVEQGGGFWLLKVGYDAEFSACSPGLLLMRETIAHAAGRNWPATNFWAGPSPGPSLDRRGTTNRLAPRLPYALRGLAAFTLDAAAALAARWRKS